jgi:hypothetical protein
VPSVTTQLQFGSTSDCARGALQRGAGRERRRGPTVELPFDDAKERYGKARAPVRGRVNGVEFRTTVAVYSGVSLIGFNKGLREQAGIEIGMT